MRITAAFVRKQQVSIVVVDPTAIQPRNRDRAQRGLQPLFAGTSVVVIAQGTAGTPTYYGLKDMSRSLAAVDHGPLPWREYEAA